MKTLHTATQLRQIRPEDVDGAVDTIAEHVHDENAEARRPVISAAADPSDGSAGGVVVTSTGRVVGCMIYTYHSESEPLGDVFARTLPHEPVGDYGVLRYAYLREDAMGGGNGTQMLDRVIQTLSESIRGLDSLYVEAWHRPDELDLRPLLEKRSFRQVFSSERYWAHPENDGRHEECPDCNVPLLNCDCGGGVYRRPLD